MTAVFPPPEASATSNRLSAWQETGVMLAAAWAVLLAFFWRDTALLADVYWNSSVYEHCIFILPVIAWLVWQRWPELRLIAPQGWWPGLIWMAGGMTCWLIGYGADINVGRHLGLVVMLQGVFLVLAGPNAARALLFPLSFSFFLVPLGDQLVMPLQLLTADMAMWLLGLVGIPAHLDGIFITTPTGYFRVAEACAGVNFLIATLVLGVLIAHLGFKHWKRRLLFVAACIIVPVLANGVRAWGTIIIAHYHGIDFAASFDHVFYGWFFFAFVLVALIGAGWRFFDRDPDDVGVAAIDFQGPIRFVMAAKTALPLALMITLPGAYFTLQSEAPAKLPARIYLPPVNGWQALDALPDWLPDYRGADHRIVQRYRDAAGREVDLFVALYARQADGGELIAVNQGASDAGHGWVRSSTEAPLEYAGVSAAVDRLTGPDKRHRIAAILYHLGGETSADTGRVKWLTLHQRLTGSDPRAAAVVVSAEGEGARAAVADFMRDMGGVGPLVERISSAKKGG